MGVPRTLVLTNDFPPRRGGIESFVEGVVRRLPPDSVVVYARGQPGDAAFDATLPFPVVRHARGIVLPEPSVARAAADLAHGERCEAVWIAAAAPLGLLAPALRARGRVGRSWRRPTGTRCGGPGCRGHGPCCTGSGTPWTR